MGGPEREPGPERERGTEREPGPERERGRERERFEHMERKEERILNTSANKASIKNNAKPCKIVCQTFVRG